MINSETLFLAYPWLNLLGLFIALKAKKKDLYFRQYMIVYIAMGISYLFRSNRFCGNINIIAGCIFILCIIILIGCMAIDINDVFANLRHMNYPLVRKIQDGVDGSKYPSTTLWYKPEDNKEDPTIYVWTKRGFQVSESYKEIYNERCDYKRMLIWYLTLTTIYIIEFIWVVLYYILLSMK